MNSKNVLVVGGAGYIGSHVSKELLRCGYIPVVFDNLCHGHRWAVRYGPLFCGDLDDRESLCAAFEEYTPCAVVHLASHIHVRESVENPYKYYHTNLCGTLNLLHVMARYGVRPLVFSSTASVYGEPNYLPIDELHPQMPLNPYGKSKWMVEQLLEDFQRAHGLQFLVLRYFNAAGADPSGEIGEAHSPETHLIPLVIQTAMKIRPFLTVYGTDHPTPDGTAIRDYVHVTDLARAHIAGIHWLLRGGEPLALNLGTGKGYSIREVISSVERLCGQQVPLQFAPRSPADPPILIADASKAQELLDWTPLHSSLDQIIQSAWDWHQLRLVVRDDKKPMQGESAISIKSSIKSPG